MNKTLGFLSTALLLALMACGAEDRSSEQPFAPTVVNKACEVVADSCRLRGEVTASPNSSLKGCGFRYGNDTLRAEVRCAVPSKDFEAFTRPLGPGQYYVVAFAENGVGRSLAPDTLYFTITD